MKRIFYIFLSRPVTTFIFFAGVTVLGIIAAVNLPVELTPEVEYPKITIALQWRGASPEVVEARVTSPIEAAVASIRGIKKITSHSSSGSSQITIEFHPSVDMKFVRLEILDKLSILKNELPYGTGVPKLTDYVPEDLSDLQGLLTYSISAPYQADVIRKNAIDKMLIPLSSVEGVSNVSVIGGREREIAVTIDRAAMRAFGIRASDINNAISEIERSGSIGGIIKEDYRLQLSFAGATDNLDIIKNQPVKSLTDGTVLKISDFCRVNFTYPEPYRYYRINGQETVSLIIDKKKGANTIETAERVKQKIKELAVNFPDEYAVRKEIDKSERMKKELDELFSGAFYSLAAIIFILFIIYRSLLRSLIIIISVIFSLLLSFLLFFIFGLSLNILTIASFVLGFGFMVDNSIVVVDFIDRNISNGNPKRMAVIEEKIFPALFASTLTTVAVFIPLVFLPGELRLYFAQFAKGIVFTLTASLIVAFTVIPQIYFKFLRTVNKRGNSNQFAKKIYAKITGLIIRFKKTSIIFVVLIIGLPVWLLPERIDTPVLGGVYNFIFDNSIYGEIKPYVNNVLGGSLNLFFNKIDRGKIWKYGEETRLAVRIELPNGNEIKRIDKICRDFESEILKYENRIDYTTANVYNEELAFIKVVFTKEQSNTAFPFMLKNYLTSYASRIGGISVGVYGFGPGFYNGLGGSMSSYRVAVKGFNFEKVRAIAKQFKSVIEVNPRVGNVDIDQSFRYGAKDVYELIGEINRDKLAYAGLTVLDLANEINAAISGNFTYGRMSVSGEEYPITIKYSGYKNIQLNELRNAVIGGDKGKVKIKDVVTFKRNKVQSVIIREEQQYVRYISFDYKGPYKYGTEFMNASLDKIFLPEGYSMERSNIFFFNDKDEETEEWKIILIAAILIFMITGALFENIKKPALIMAAVPFAAVGAITLFYLFDFTFNRGAYAGLLLLVGLSVNNSILLTDYISKNSKSGKIAEIIELSYHRLKPIFTTSLTTIAALMPLLFLTDSEFWQSLSLSIIGGIGLSALLTLLYIPLIYCLLNKIQE